MRNILDIGKQGAEHVDVAPPELPVAVSELATYLGVVANFPRQKVMAEVSDGRKQAIEVHRLNLGVPRVFDLAHRLAPFEPSVYARQGDRVVFGMLSPNYDTHGVDRRPSLKVIPLGTPYPLTASHLPDARMLTMLAGSARAEGPGSGSHDKPVAEDFEHKLAVVGAVSLGKASISGAGGSHVNHAAKDNSSVATALTSGQVGNVFRPGTPEVAEFTGYGQPLLFDRAMSTSQDAIFMPRSFVADPERAFGVFLDDASRIMYGAGLQVVYQRGGQAAVSDQIKRIAEHS